MARHLAFTLVCLSAFATGSAHAEIESFAPTVDEKPLLTINFNQKHTYFDRALSQGVSAAEQAKQGVVYHVVSYAPQESGGAMNPQAEDNLRKVVEGLRGQGVPTERIQVLAQPYPADGATPSYQKVAIFVR